MDPYFTIVIPYQARFATNMWMPTDATGPFSTLTRGVFLTRPKAREWARKTLPKGAKYRVREVRP